MKTFFYLSCVYALLSQNAFCEMPMVLEKPKFISLTTEPIAAFMGDFHIQSEFRIADGISIVMPIGVYNANWAPFKLLTGLDPSQLNGMTFPGWIAGAGIGLKLFPFGKALASGLYAHFLLFMGGGQSFGLNSTIALAQQRFHIGYTWIMESGFVMDIYGGFQNSNFSNIGGQGFIPVAGFKFGYAV